MCLLPAVLPARNGRRSTPQRYMRCGIYRHKPAAAQLLQAPALNRSAPHPLASRHKAHGTQHEQSVPAETAAHAIGIRRRCFPPMVFYPKMEYFTRKQTKNGRDAQISRPFSTKFQFNRQAGTTNRDNNPRQVPYSKTPVSGSYFSKCRSSRSHTRQHRPAS